MQYSLVNGRKEEAQPNLEGTCLLCGGLTYSACGKFNIWHWRHKGSKHCDKWWEAETDWHRECKSNFPQEWREVIQFDTETNEKHIADIKTNRGIVLEFQNSQISVEEIKSREKFYKKMVWVVNGKQFKNNFEFGYKLPSPSSQFPEGFKLLGHKHPMAYKDSGIKNQSENFELVQILNEINGEGLTDLIEKYHVNHFAFNWKRERQVWREAKMPIFIDFNENILWRILHNSRVHDEPICAYYSKKQFIKHYQ